MNAELIKELADAHWGYIETTLIQHKVPTYDIDIARYHYLTAFIHGYRHGVEDHYLRKALWITET